MTTSNKLITADELLKMGDIGRCELIYGELVMMSPAGAEHGMVVARFNRYLSEFVEERKLGFAFGAETGFKLSSDPDTVRGPDASYVRRQRVKGKLTKKFFDGAPDLAVEVMSPDDTKREVADTKNAWLAHGATSVWIADPDTQTVVVHHSGEKPAVFSRGEKLTDERVLPGFTLEVDRIFKWP